MMMPRIPALVEAPVRISKRIPAVHTRVVDTALARDRRAGARSARRAGMNPEPVRVRQRHHHVGDLVHAGTIQVQHGAAVQDEARVRLHECGLEDERRHRPAGFTSSREKAVRSPTAWSPRGSPWMRRVAPHTHGLVRLARDSLDVEPRIARDGRKVRHRAWRRPGALDPRTAEQTVPGSGPPARRMPRQGPSSIGHSAPSATNVSSTGAAPATVVEMRTPGSLVARVTHVRWPGRGPRRAACGSSSQHPSHGPSARRSDGRRAVLLPRRPPARSGPRPAIATPFSAVRSGEQSTCRRSA